MSKVVAKTPELSLMIERIRDNHIDINLIIQNELKLFLSDNLESIVYEVYAELDEVGSI